MTGASVEGLGIVVADNQQSFSVPMADLYAVWLRATLPEREERLSELVAARRAELAALLARAEHRRVHGDRSRVYPQIRTRDWVLRRSPAFGIGALVMDELEGELVICYAWEGEEELSLVTEAELRALRLSPEALAELALANLHAECEAFELVPSAEEREKRITAESGHAAERLLLALGEEDLPGLDTLVFALPERGELCVGRQDSGLSELMQHVDERHAGAAEPLSRQLFAIENHRLAPWSPEESRSTEEARSSGE